MTKTNNHYFRKLTILLATMATGLVLASGVALAVTKVCPTGTTQANPCSGTSGIDTLIGTNWTDYIEGRAGNDKISGGAGGWDFTDGGAGNDTYSYKVGWGEDFVTDASGIDHFNFSAVGSGGVHVSFLSASGGSVRGPSIGYYEERISFTAATTASSNVIEKVTGSSGYDTIRTGGVANTLKPGPGTGGAEL